MVYTSRPEASLDLEDPTLAGVTAVVRTERGMDHYATLAEHVRRAVAVESGM